MRFLKELRRVAGEKVEVVHPRGRRGLEDVAPHEVVLLADQELPGIGLVERVVACLSNRESKMSENGFYGCQLPKLRRRFCQFVGSSKFAEGRRWPLGLRDKFSSLRQNFFLASSNSPG